MIRWKTYQIILGFILLYCPEFVGLLGFMAYQSL